MTHYHAMQIEYRGVPSVAFVEDRSDLWLLRASEALVLSKYLKEDEVKKIELGRKIQKMVDMANEGF